MSGFTLRIIIAAVLFLHGVGHIMGVIPALRPVKVEGWNSYSPVFTPLLGETRSRFVGVVLFLASLAGFVAAALALMGWLVPHDLWRSLSIVSAVISMLAIGFYWDAFVAFFPNKVGALTVDVAVLVCLVVLNWPPEAAIGY